LIKTWTRSVTKKRASFENFIKSYYSRNKLEVASRHDDKFEIFLEWWSVKEAKAELGGTALRKNEKEVDDEWIVNVA
jgi:phosphopantetheinyl transferase